MSKVRCNHLYLFTIQTDYSLPQSSNKVKVKRRKTKEDRKKTENKERECFEAWAAVVELVAWQFAKSEDTGLNLSCHFWRNGWRLALKYNLMTNQHYNSWFVDAIPTNATSRLYNLQSKIKNINVENIRKRLLITCTNIKKDILKETLKD
jgi:hypothetical protein